MGTIIEPKKVRSSSKLSSGSTGLSIKTGHTRGLSIFQEISPDAVGDFLSGDGAKATAAKNPATTTTTKTIAPEIAHSSSVTTAQPSNHHHRSTVSQLLVDIVET